MKQNNLISGFTIIELLIGVLLASIIMLAVSILMQQTAVSNARLNQTNSLIREGQIAQQIISGRLAEAIYVWPSGFTAGTISFNDGFTTKNTVMSPTPVAAWPLGLATGGTQTYYKGSTTEANPMRFVAMILPPSNPTYDGAGNITNCKAAIATPVAGSTTDTDAATTTDGCYRFFAYFPMRRSYLSNPTNGLSDINRPLEDKLNDFPTDINQDRWVIMELRANMFAGGTMWLPNYGGATTVGAGNPKLGVGYGNISWSSISSTYLAKRDASVLVDYVKPGSLEFRVYRPGSPNAAGGVDPTITVSGGTQSALNTNNGRVDYKFEMERFIPGKTMSASKDPLGGSITVKNWYCPKAMVISPFALNCP